MWQLSQVWKNRRAAARARSAQYPRAFSAPARSSLGLRLAAWHAASLARNGIYAAAVATMGATMLPAQDGDVVSGPGIALAADQEPTRNRVGLNFRLGYNISAEFKGLGGFPAQTNPGPPAGGGVDREYDDGYNRVDVSGNNGGLTWNWGYDNASQVPGNDTVVMHSTSGIGNASTGEMHDDPHPGFELTYGRDLGEAWKGRWGWEGAFGFSDLEIRQRGMLSGDLTRLSDAYALNGVVPPLAPYAGSFSGPGPLIGDSPSRTIEQVSGGALVGGVREFDASFYGVRTGPYWDLALSDKALVSLSGGLAMAVVDGEFGYRESVTVSGQTLASSSGRNADTDFLLGGYASVMFHYLLRDDLRAYGGAQYQNLGSYDNGADGREAKIDFGAVFFLTMGFNYSF